MVTLEFRMLKAAPAIAAPMRWLQSKKVAAGEPLMTSDALELMSMADSLKMPGLRYTKDARICCTA